MSNCRDGPVCSLKSYPEVEAEQSRDARRGPDGHAVERDDAAREQDEAVTVQHDVNPTPEHLRHAQTRAGLDQDADRRPRDVNRIAGDADLTQLRERAGAEAPVQPAAREAGEEQLLRESAAVPSGRAG